MKKTSTTDTQLIDKKTSVYNDPTITCKFCKKSYKNLKNLETHLRNIHKELTEHQKNSYMDFLRLGKDERRKIGRVIKLEVQKKQNELEKRKKIKEDKLKKSKKKGYKKFNGGGSVFVVLSHFESNRRKH